MGDPDFLTLVDGTALAYRHLPGQTPGILFCPGFNSDMQGQKALALEQWCRDRGRQFTRFDYFGHGQSSGSVEEGTIGRWRDDTLAVLDRVTTGPQLIVGSSMGGWLMLLAALERPERVAALVGVAAAPDFTRALAREGLSDDQRLQLQQKGYCDMPNCYDDGEPYRISRRLLEEGEAHLLLERDIPLDVPVRLIQGQRDPDVPWQHALRISAQLRSEDVEVILLKSGDHRLSSPGPLQRLLQVVRALLEDLEQPAGNR